MDYAMLMELALSLIVAMFGAAIYSLVWWAMNNQTDPQMWDMTKLYATMALGAVLGALGWYHSIPVTMETIGPLILAYVFLLPMIEKIIKFIFRAFTGPAPAQATKSHRPERWTGLREQLILINKKTGGVYAVFNPDGTINREPRPEGDYDYNSW
jgi:hypothetical protein